MKPRKGQLVKFKAMDDFTGEEIELSGTIVGDYKMIKEKYPLEMGEVDKKSNLYLVEVSNRSGKFVVHISEVIKNLGVAYKETT